MREETPSLQVARDAWPGQGQGIGVRGRFRDLSRVVQCGAESPRSAVF